MSILAFWAIQQRNRAIDKEKQATKLSENLQAQTDNLSLTLERLEAEQAAKAALEFQELRARASTILEVGGCPEAILTQMQTLADDYTEQYQDWNKIVNQYKNQAICD